MQVVKDMGSDVKKRDWFYSKVCKHAKNWKTHVFCNQKTIDAQLAHGVLGDKAQKVVQFSTMFHLLYKVVQC
jgi:hypothetical protein